MSQLNIEDFQIDQWMFLFDGYGIAYHDVEKDLLDNDDAEIRYGVVNGKFAKRTKEAFQPYMIQFMCKKPEGNSFEPDFEDYSKKEMRFYRTDGQGKMQVSSILASHMQDGRTVADQRVTLGQTQLGFTGNETKEDMEQKIFTQVRRMQDALAVSNTKRTEIDRIQAENDIEKAFFTKDVK